MKIKYSTALTGLKIGDVPVYRFYVRHNGTVREDTFYQSASQGSGIAPFALKLSMKACLNQIMEEARHGNRVELPEMSAFLTMRGAFDGMSREARDAADARLAVRLAAKGALKTCCQGDGFVLTNVTEGATVVIRGISDMAADRDDVIINGTNVEVHIIGTGLYIPETGDETVGVWLADTDGIVLATARITESTATTLACVFPEIDLHEGTYRLCVASRNGLDPEQYGATIAHRNVAVVNATEGEEDDHE